MADGVDDGRRMYDVFLSFRGEDTRKNFTDHLYHELRDAGIHVFRDDNELQRGENITCELEQAIHISKIAIIVFSKNYADSRWCLEELVKIMECKRTQKQVVLPVFYDVDPSDVRNQKGSFEEAFVQHQQRFPSNTDKLLRWRTVLTEAANLAGFDLKNSEDGYEGKFIKKVVQKVLRDLKKNIHVAHYQVGIDSRVNAITSELDVFSGGVRMVGIWGMGGLGKTTTAKALYNLLYDKFDGACFLSDVKDAFKESNGLVRLQEKLLNAIFKSSKIELQSDAEGITQLQRLGHKKVLLILDDIDDMEQLNALARSRDWFGEGSRIIITTRDEHLLKILKVDAVCTVKEMSNIEALELFSWHAFDNSCPSEDYYHISSCVVNYCGGLPLALQVIGSHLYGRTKSEWEDAMDQLKRIPDNDIHKKLKISFDGLNNSTHREIFLHVACFFLGRDKNEVIQILNACGLSSTIGINVLLQRCLLKVDYKSKLMMHDLLRDMGREIVHNESPKEPGKRSRLFVEDDVLYVLENGKGTDSIEALSLNFPSKVLTTEGFKEMKKLKLLQLNYALTRGGFEHFPKEIRWLCWHGFPLKFLPNNFNLEKVVAIDFRYSHLTKFFHKEPKFLLENLTVLNLSHSHDLKCTPNFSNLVQLEELNLKDCKSLVKVDDSIGSLKKLVLINMEGCICLNKLPETLSEIKSLETLILHECSKLRNLPKNLGKMESLKFLQARDTCMQELPSTIVKLKKLERLYISRPYEGPDVVPKSHAWISPRKFSNPVVLPTTLRGLESLTELCLPNCSLSDDAIPQDIGSLVSLVRLHLEGNDFHALPSSIAHLSNLKFLVLSDCSELEHISNLPPNLTHLSAIGCKALERISSLSNTNRMHVMNLDLCPNLAEISSLDEFLFSKSDGIYVIFSMQGCSKLKQSFKENILQKMFEEKNQGIRLHTCPDGANSEESSWSLYHDASQILDFNFQGDITSFYGSDDRQHFPKAPGYCHYGPKWDLELPKVADDANGMTHTIGNTCFDLSGRSSKRCVLIRKYHRIGFPGYLLGIQCIKFISFSRTWFTESFLMVE